MTAPRALWKGYLKLGAVSCGIKLIGAVTEADKIRLNTINRKTGNQVRSVYMDEETGDEVESDEQVKGYAMEGGQYLLIDPEEVKKLRPESDKMLEIQSFVELDKIDPRYLDKPYYLMPGDPTADETYAVIREALKQKKVAAQGYVVLFQRGRNVLIQPHGKGLIMTILRSAAELVDEDTIFGGIEDKKIDKEMAEIAGMIIDRKETTFEPKAFEDSYEDALAALIEAKRQGKKPPAPAPRPKETNVINLADVLRKSLEKEGGGSPKKPKPGRKRG
ncbi:MAG: Ku protein [Rhizobiaceae bacterium]|nr:Ku protein [Rhizobiaceae bacterium]